ncbi:MAG TPA: hypothetical protein DDW52_25060 [Planctomycetaceae bacterium]|nr:hypothetical protein [Planctomycetaceae bacterium]
MKNAETQTIETFAQRSDSAVVRIALIFAMGGALMDIGSHLISSLFMQGRGVSMLWGMWIPLCFMTIPPIHYLCRRVRDLEDRIEAIAQEAQDRNAA